MKIHKICLSLLYILICTNSDVSAMRSQTIPYHCIECADAYCFLNLFDVEHLIYTSKTVGRLLKTEKRSPRLIHKHDNEPWLFLPSITVHDLLTTLSLMECYRYDHISRLQSTITEAPLEQIIVYINVIDYLDCPLILEELLQACLEKLSSTKLLQRFCCGEEKLWKSLHTLPHHRQTDLGINLINNQPYLKSALCQLVNIAKIDSMKLGKGSSFVELNVDGSYYSTVSYKVEL